MESLRLLQLIENISIDFIKQKGRLPLKQELDVVLRKTNEYTPFSKPMVPLQRALSNAEFVTHTLVNIMKDSNSITELIKQLNDKADRIENTSTQELVNLQIKAAKLIELYKDEYTKLVYSEKPGIPESDSNNIYYGKEGIQINPSTKSPIDFNYNIVPYSATNDLVKLSTLSTEPLHIIAGGSDNSNKGITLNIHINSDSKFLSTITLESTPATVEVILNGESLLIRDIIDSETFIIGKEVESLSLNIYSNAYQVDINISTLKLYNSIYETNSGYDIGVYVSPKIYLGNDNGRLLFDPSSFIPDDAGIVWYYSTDYIEGGSATWNLIEKDSNDNMRLWWNTSQETPIIDTYTQSTNNKRVILHVPDNVYEGTEVTSGKNCILFIADKKNSLYKFTTYIVVPEEGYLLEIENPALSSDYLVKNVSITSDSFSYNEETITNNLINKEVTEGTHLLEIELSSPETFDAMDDYSDILNQIETTLQVELNIRSFFDNDHLGRSVALFITKLQEEDYNIIDYTRARERAFMFASSPSHNISVENWNLTPSKYDIVLLDDFYKEGATYTAHKEEQIYAGTGESWYFNLYHEPLGDIQIYGPDLACFGSTGFGATAGDGTCIGASTDTVLVADTTITGYVEYLNYKGTDPVVPFTLSNQQISGGTAALTASAYSINETWSYDNEGATLTLGRIPTGAITVMDSAGATQTSTYTSPGGSGEDGGYISVDSPGASAVYTAYYNCNVSIREQNETTVTLENLPPFPFGASPILNTETIPTTTPLGASGASGDLYIEDIFLTYNIDSIYSLEYESADGMTGLSIGGASGISGATGGDLHHLENKMITVNTILLSEDQELTIKYYTYDLSPGYPFSLTYDYFDQVSYFFTYNYETSDYVNPSDIYGNTGMLDYFYDISYYVPGSTSDSIHLKAVMKGTSKETPIIRRIRLRNE